MINANRYTCLGKLWVMPAAAALAAALGSPLWGQRAPVHMRIDLEQAIQLAVAHNHNLKAAATQIQQNEAEEITAALRPNPVFTYDDLFIPITPNQFTSSNIDNITEFDLGVGYTWERGHKRQARIAAAKDVTTVSRSQVKDNERSLVFNVAQQFVNVLLAQSTLDFAKQDLASFQQTVDLSQARYTGGAISEGDLLKIKLQLLQFQTDVSAAQLSLAQARAGLRQLLGFESVPMDFEVSGELAYAPVRGNQEDFQALALKQRPDLIAAEQGVTSANSQYNLAKANAKRDLTTSLFYTHVSGISSASYSMNIEIPVFDRNQGEIARAHYGITQADELKTAASETVMTDVVNSYQGLATNDQIVKLYTSGYLKQAQDSRDISEYAYKRGAASLLDYLDAERTYRSTELAYRQSLANFMLSVEQLKEAIGTRNLP